MKVKCIDNSGSMGDLQIDAVYEVVKDNGSDYVIVMPDGTKISWRKKRFVELQEGQQPTSKRVKCINNGGTAKPYLNMGKIYQVVNEDVAHYYVGVSLDGWHKSRFEVVSDTSTPPTHTQAPDLSDWRMWRGKPDAGNCVCGCAKELCFIHKD